MDLEKVERLSALAEEQRALLWEAEETIWSHPETGYKEWKTHAYMKKVLEDRIVKQQMHDWCQGCICPKDFPVCVCGRKPRGKLLYKKGLAPSEAEVAENPRARSARLRVIEKLPEE